MADPIKDVKRAIGELGMAEPVVWIGRKLAEGGALIQRGIDTVRGKVAPPVKDPRIGRKLAPKRRMSR